jgi:hypothetical protein
MATTPNFNWSTPDNTGLVKNGALDIRTLGNSIDASMADLKGGTTGQVLTKASGTDMDFTWATASGGSNTFYAGKNKMINGKFDIWQRGTSISLPNGSWTYGPDRFAAYSAFSAGTSTFSRQTFTPGAAPVAGYEAQYFARLTCGSTATFFQIEQRLEDVRTFAGQTVTVSFWAKSSATPTVKVTTYQNFGTGGSSGVNTDGSNFALTSSWVRYTATLSIPSISGKTIGVENALNVGLVHVSGGINSATIDTWGWQIEAGSSATDFQTATGSLQGELAASQRYYFRFSADGAYSLFGTGSASSTTNAYTLNPIPVTMRVAPHTLDYSTLALYDGVSVIAVTSASLLYNDRNVGAVGMAVASGLTQFRPYLVLSNNSTSAFLGFSAEL